MGLKELVLIALVTLVLYGRSGVLKSERAQTVLPWVSPVRRRPRPGAPPKRSRSRIAGAFLTRGNKLYWALTILAATAVGAWIVTRTLISTGASH
ncbi:hypothetical protein [Paludisphaera borealis]|uniref:Uncharacterized protein n=1 Tax=Paludisphaera borealis TaxID=1387353 RepID=A0A1U7CQR1_9BACT|nr:hypothetical protein [Paludisphaera borealis]APW61280.1 hypothetical protein BSF38_02792 [Paludisphaera borealis]